MPKSQWCIREQRLAFLIWCHKGAENCSCWSMFNTESAYNGHNCIITELGSIGRRWPGLINEVFFYIMCMAICVCIREYIWQGCTMERKWAGGGIFQEFFVEHNEEWPPNFPDHSQMFSVRYAGQTSLIHEGSNSQLTIFKGFTGDTLVPDTTVFLPRSCELHASTGQSCFDGIRRIYIMLGRWF